MNIGIDIDGVLIDIKKFQLDRGKKFFNVPVVNSGAYTSAEIFNVSKHDDIKFWKENVVEYTKNYEYRPDAEEIVRKIREDGHRAFIVTNRAMNFDWCGNVCNTERMIKDNLSSLNRNGIAYDEIVFSDNKRETCKKLGIDVIIEDATFNLVTLDLVKLLICFTEGHNSHIVQDNMKRVRNFTDAYKCIQGIA